MSKKMPPVPPAGRSDKGPPDASAPSPEDTVRQPAPENPEQQGQQGNVRQNTTHQGYQQDR